MKLQATQENLHRALNNVARVAISSRNPLPILNNVLLRVVDNRLTLSATNLEIGITEHIGAKVTTAGALTVPARLFQEYIASLPSGVIDLDIKDNKLHIKTGSYESTINGVAADEFPVTPTIDKKESWKIPARELKKGLSQVIFAAANDETRPILTGVYLHSHNGHLYAVATDSYRLAEKKLMAFKGDINLLIPASSLQDLLRIIADSDGDVVVYADGQQALFEVGDSELITRLLEGNYPDYRKLLPPTFAVKANLQRSEFQNITKVASLFARESAGSIMIRFDEDSEVVSIASVASQLGENISKIETKVTGNGDVSVNSRYLIDALNVFHSETVTFSCNGKVEPCVITSDEEPDYLHVIMPLKS
jgi:DNA polymerase-3 subunit beta